MAFASFALPSKLYLDGKDKFYEIEDDTIYDENSDIVATIKDGKLYDKDGKIIGTIIDNKTSISLNFFENEKLKYCFDFNSETGFINKGTSYSNGIIDESVIFEYDKENLSKIMFYDSENSFLGYDEYFYDKKTGICTKVTKYDKENQIRGIRDFDSKTGKIIRSQRFNADGSLKWQTTFDKKTEEPLERLVYTKNPKKPEKWTFIQFDEDNEYKLSDNYSLIKAFFRTSELREFAEESKNEPINWSDNYNVVVRKFNFTENSDGYSYIANLKEKKYLSSKNITLYNKNFDICYFFSTDENDEIDISSCYEIEFIEKPRDYSIYRNNKGSGVFGFEIGMTYEEIKEACNGNEPEHIADNRYIVKPKKSHPLFEKYIVWISDSVGLYYIKGISRDINTNGYGTEVKNKFNDLLASLENKYGKFSITDTVKSDYYLKQDQYWMSALNDGARKYEANWSSTEENLKNSNGISSIYIGISAEYSTSAYIWIEYGFVNSFDAEQETDDVL